MKWSGISAISALCMACLLPATANASVIYDYVGAPFTSFQTLVPTGPESGIVVTDPIPGWERVTGFVEFREPLIPNKTYDSQESVDLIVQLEFRFGDVVLRGSDIDAFATLACRANAAGGLNDCNWFYRGDYRLNQVPFGIDLIQSPATIPNPSGQICGDEIFGAPDPSVKYPGIAAGANGVIDATGGGNIYWRRRRC